jgi:hypothetical protein
MNGLRQLSIKISESEFQEISEFSHRKGLTVEEMILSAIQFWKSEKILDSNIKKY